MNIKKNFYSLRAKYLSKSCIQMYTNRSFVYKHIPKDKIEQIVLGDSHAQYAVYPQLFDKYTFNAGETSADLFTSYHLACFLLEKCSKTQTVILFFSFYSGGFDLSACNEKWRCPALSYFLPVPVRHNIPWSIRWGVCLKILRYHLKPQQHLDSRGWSEPNVFSPKNASVQLRVAGHYKQATAYGNRQLEYLSKLENLCKQLGKKFVLILPPERSDYRKELEKFGTFLYGTAHGSRLTAHGSRLTAHGSRLTAHGSRLILPCFGLP